MKNDYVWARTVLTVYRYLERIAGAIDKIVLQSALSSAYVSSENFYQNNVYTVSQKLIDLGQRKITLINLKLLIEDALKFVSEKDAEILVEKFFDGVKSKDIAQNHNISMRTVFRRIDAAVKSFSNVLCMKGYGNIALQKMLKDENWILCVFERFCTKPQEEFSFSQIFLKKAVSM